jgi:hypothetical protein
MRSMSSFDPDQPARVHDALTDRKFCWGTKWADHWNRYARLDENGVAYFNGMILDGWEPIGDESRGAQ